MESTPKRKRFSNEPIAHLAEVIKSRLEINHEFRINGLFRLKPVRVPEVTYTEISSLKGERTYTIPAHTNLEFSIGKEVKELLNKNNLAYLAYLNTKKGATDG